MKNTNKEKLILFLNNEFSKSKTNNIYIYKSDISSIGLTEQQITQTLSLLEDDKYIEIMSQSVHDNLSMPWSIKVKSSCIDYFDKKKTTRNQLIIKVLKEIRAWGTLAIAILSLILSL